MPNLILSNGITFLEVDRANFNTWLATGVVPGGPPIQPPPGGPPPVWNDNQRLWIAAATGHPDMDLLNRLGQVAYNNAVQVRSTGGTLYDPTLFGQAGMAGGIPPPNFTWASHQAAGDGSVVNGQWVWAPRMYPLFLALR